MKDKLRQIENSHHFWYALGISFLFFLLRLPSLFEPFWYGDEGIYETLGLAISRGRVLYTQIWDNKPPLLYYTYALFQGDQFYVRLLSLFVGISCILIFFALCQKIFNAQKRPVFIATATFAILFGLPFIEGNIANAENFMLLPIIAAAYSIYTYPLKNGGIKRLAIAGILLGIAFLYKIVGIFDFAALLVFLSITAFPNSYTAKAIFTYVTKFIRTASVFALGFVLPFLISVLYFLSQGALGAYTQAVFLSTVGYVGYGNTFIIPQGLLISKLLVLVAFVLYLLIKRQSVSRQTLFISLWVAFSLFNSFFSQRPYTHYVLVLLPSFSLVIGSIFFTKNRFRIVSLLAGILLSFTSLFFFNHWSVQKTVGYYTNFMSFITGEKSVTDYEAFFDRRVPQDMELVHYLNTHGKDNKTLFIWGNAAQIYYQTGTLPPGRFTVAYHIAGLKDHEEETARALKDNPSDFTIVFANAPNHTFPLTKGRQVLTTKEATIYEKIN